MSVPQTAIRTWLIIAAYSQRADQDAYEELVAQQGWNKRADLPPPNAAMTNSRIPAHKRFQRRLLQAAAIAVIVFDNSTAPMK